MRKFISLLLILTSFSLCGCAGESGNAGNAAQGSGDAAQGATYKQITQEEASSIMVSESGYIILDVRTYEEYNQGHIDGAICVPNESITGADIPELPDKNQLILVYCRSGRRSKEASQKLADMGYTNVMEFGGIIDWAAD